jgi:hypothetical protein
MNGVDPATLEIIDCWTNEIGDSDNWVELTAWTPKGWLTTDSRFGHIVDQVAWSAQGA